MALNTVARVSLEDTVAYTGKVGDNSVTEGQSSRVEGLNSGTEGSTSFTEKQNSGTDGQRLRLENTTLTLKWRKSIGSPTIQNLFSGSVNSNQDLNYLRVMMKGIEIL